MLPLLQSFDAELLGRLNELGDLARFGPGEILFGEGDRTDTLNVLLAGYVALTHSQPGNDDASIDVIAPVKPIGFASAWLELPSQIAARTVTSARLIMIPIAELRAMIAAEPRLGLPFLDHALSEMNELAQDVCKLKLRSSAQRLAEYLLAMIDDPEQSPARFVLPYEKRFLAGKIGCSQANLSRAFAALRRVGVGTQQGGVIVRDVAALRDFAGVVAPLKELPPPAGGATDSRAATVTAAVR